MSYNRNVKKSMLHKSMLPEVTDGLMVRLTLKYPEGHRTMMTVTPIDDSFTSLEYTLEKFKAEVWSYRERERKE